MKASLCVMMGYEQNERGSIMSSRRALIMLGVIIVGTLLLFSTLFFKEDFNKVAPTVKPSATEKINTTPSKKIHKLTMNVRVSADEYNALQKLVKHFEKKNPSIQIKVTNVIPEKGQSYYEALKLKAQLAKMSDITIMDSNWVEEFAALGYLDYLDDHYIGVPMEKYVNSLLLPIKWNGFYWGVPLDFNPYILVYREEILKKYGLKTPDGQLASWLKQLKVMNKPKNQKAEPLYMDANDPYQLLVLDSDALTEAIKRQGTGSEQLEIRIPRSMQDEQLWGDFKAGRWVFMVTSLSEALENQSSDAPITITTIPQLPTIVNREGLLFEGRSFVVSSSSRYREDAMKWLQFISDKEVLADWYDDTKQLPSIIESYASKQLQSTVPKVILERLDKPVHSLAKPEFPLKVDELMMTIDDVWSGKQKSDVLFETLDQLRITE